jgi:hypothetical protein
MLGFPCAQVIDFATMCNMREEKAMFSRVFCGKCRREIDRETFNFWQGTAWCSHCQEVVTGALCKVPLWVVGTVLFLAARLRIT